MKRILLIVACVSLLYSCEYLNGPTTINQEITSQYLLDGNLDVYLSNNQIFRYKGKPGNVAIPVGNENLSNYENCFILYVASGTTQETIVSSASIKLDGIDVLNTSDFSKNMGQYSFEVCNLSPTSELTIEIMGQPGSFLDIWIEGKLKALTVTDIDGNVYKTVKIGEQVWMAENLKTTKYCNGDLIGTTDPVTLDISGETAPKYQWAFPDLPGSVNNVATYGRLYTWYAVSDPRNVCPCGWHVPTYNELVTLQTFLGGVSVAGGKLKESGTTHWRSPNTGATNESGFTALPGGGRVSSRGGHFINLWINGSWWSSSEKTPTIDAYDFGLSYVSTNMNISYLGERYGLSVRCLQGEPPELPVVTTGEVSSITQTTAASGGNVISEGSSPVTSRGVCFSTNPNPITLDPTKTEDGTGSGSFSSSITGLAANTQYYARAYAINSAGVAYGGIVSFKTKNFEGGEFLYIACENSDYILQYKMDGSGTLGKVGTGFNGVSSLAINPITGELYLSDDDGLPGVYVVHSDQSVGSVGSNGDFSNPNALAFDNQNRLLVADAGNSILRYDLTQNQIATLGTGYSIPQGVVFYENTIYFSDANGYIYFIDSNESNLPVYQSDISHRLITTPIVEESYGGMISDNNGKLYASDGSGHVAVIDIINKTYEYINIGDGIITRGLALIENKTKLLVSDFNHNRIFVVDLSDKSVSVFLENSLITGSFGLLVTSKDFGFFQR